MVDRLRRGRARVELRFDDPSQTPDVGLLLADRLDLVGTLDRHIGPVKQRRRGVGGGALVMALAESMLVGGDFLCDLDTRRADRAWKRCDLRWTWTLPTWRCTGHTSRGWAGPTPASAAAGRCWCAGRRRGWRWRPSCWPVTKTPARSPSGLFAGQVAHAAVAADADFAIAAKRNPAVWRAIHAVPDDAWTPARGMPGAEVAGVAYAPAGWPEGTYAVVRRVRVGAADVSADPRARRRRTFDPGQLRLALGGQLDQLYAYSIIVTNIDDDPVSLEAWFRERAQIEERIKDSKLGMALRHLPSGSAQVNAVWMWAALLALNCSVLLQALGGIDTCGRAHGKRLRRELIGVPGRLVRHAGQLLVRLSPRYAYLDQVRQRLAALPAPAG